MKKILFIRHAKSSWKDSELQDIDRPLKDRGVKDAELMSEVVARLDLKLDLILCSPARRTIQTAEIFLQKVFLKSKFKIEQNLYDASRTDYYRIIKKLDESCSQVAIIGHNPDISYTASELCNENIILPTTGIALLEFVNLKWTEVAQGSGNLVLLDRPKAHK